MTAHRMTQLQGLHEFALSVGLMRSFQGALHLWGGAHIGQA